MWSLVSATIGTAALGLPRERSDQLPAARAFTAMWRSKDATVVSRMDGVPRLGMREDEAPQRTQRAAASAITRSGSEGSREIAGQQHHRRPAPRSSLGDRSGSSSADDPAWSASYWAPVRQREVPSVVGEARADPGGDPVRRPTPVMRAAGRRDGLRLVHPVVPPSMRPRPRRSQRPGRPTSAAPRPRQPTRAAPYGKRGVGAFGDLDRRRLGLGRLRAARGQRGYTAIARAKPRSIGGVRVSPSTSTPSTAATAGLTYVMTVARTGPASRMSAAKTTNARAVQTMPSMTSETSASRDGWDGGPARGGAPGRTGARSASAPAP